MKWNRISVVALLAVLLAATALVGTAAGDQAAEHPRPFKVSMELRSSVIGPPGSFGCDPASLPYQMVGDGHATHMGEIDVVDGFVCNSLETGAFTNGSATYVAANGDTIAVVFAGMAYLNPDGSYTGDGSAVAISGTGRFASVSGEWAWTLTGMLYPDGTTTSDLEGVGWIAYNASDRSN